MFLERHIEGSYLIPVVQGLTSFMIITRGGWMRLVGASASCRLQAAGPRVRCEDVSALGD